MHDSDAPALAGWYDPRKYGARADGRTLDTAALQAAIDAAGAAGGGQVVLSGGVFRSGPIRLASGVYLHVAYGATLRASDDLADYRPQGGGRAAGLIRADGARGVGIVGGGVIDCSGMAFMQRDGLHVLSDFDASLTRQGASFAADRSAITHGPYAYEKRPDTPVAMHLCEDVVVRDVTFRDSPGWTFRLAGCRGVEFSRVVIDNDLGIPNSDGIHVTACRNVRIADCDISAGDDAIAITTVAADRFLGEAAPAEARITENVTVSGCVLRSRSAGVRIGYGPYDMRRIVLTGLAIYGSHRGVGIFARDGGSIRDVLCQNLAIQTELLSGHWWGRGEAIQVSALPGNKPAGDCGRIESVRFVNVAARGPAGVVLWAERPGLVRDVTFTGMDIHLEPSELEEAWGGNFDLRPAEDFAQALFAHDIPALHAQNILELSLRDLRVRWGQGLADHYTRPVELVGCRGVEVFGVRGGPRVSRDAPVVARECRDVTLRDVEGR